MTESIMINSGKNRNEINILISYLKTKIEIVKKFLELKVLKNNVELFICNKEEFDNYFKLKMGYNPNDDAVGFEKDGTIYCLDYDDYNKTTHKNENIEFFYRIIFHEICHFILNEFSKNRPYRFLNEGFALFFAEQYDKIEGIITIELEDLINEKNIDYYQYYLIFHYIMNNYEKHEILKLLYDREYAFNNIEKIYLECKNYYKGE